MGEASFCGCSTLLQEVQAAEDGVEAGVDVQWVHRELKL
jgi:hypothetical protein